MQILVTIHKAYSLPVYFLIKWIYTKKKNLLVILPKKLF